MKDHRENGHAAERVLPKITITWDAESQAADAQFDPREFKNYEFILAVLEMTRLKIDNIRRMTLAAQVQQSQQQAQIDAAIRNKIIKG